MHRTQIQIEERQYRFLRDMARRNGTSISAVLRELIDHRIQAQPREDDPLQGIIGMADGPQGDTARKHDRFLYSGES